MGIDWNNSRIKVKSWVFDFLTRKGRYLNYKLPIVPKMLPTLYQLWMILIMVVDFNIKTTLLKINPKFPKIYSGLMDIIKLLWIIIQPAWKITKIFSPILTILLAYQICGQPKVMAAGRKETFYFPLK